MNFKPSPKLTAVIEQVVNTIGSEGLLRYSTYVDLETQAQEVTLIYDEGVNEVLEKVEKHFGVEAQPNPTNHLDHFFEVDGVEVVVSVRI